MDAVVDPDDDVDFNATVDSNAAVESDDDADFNATFDSDVVVDSDATIVSDAALVSDADAMHGRGQEQAGEQIPHRIRCRIRMNANG